MSKTMITAAVLSALSFDHLGSIAAIGSCDHGEACQTTLAGAPARELIAMRCCRMLLQSMRI